MRRLSNVLMCVGLLALLAVPTTALSQGTVESGWTDSPPNLNGSLGSGEWAAATRLPLWIATNTAPSPPGLEGILDIEEIFAEEVSPQQATGWLYLMNDAQFFYLAATLDMEGPSGHPDYFLSALDFWFEDEPRIGNGRWAASLCSENPDEGMIYSLSTNMASSDLDLLEVAVADVDLDYFEPIAEEGTCTFESPAGYRRRLGHDPMTFETRLNLGVSPLDVAPGECFYAGLVVTDLELFISEEFAGVAIAVWPDDIATREFELPDVLTEVCLAEAPIVEEEFVPEPGTVVLLGTGLAGLGGYAVLRWRSRRRD